MAVQAKSHTGVSIRVKTEIQVGGAKNIGPKLPMNRGSVLWLSDLAVRADIFVALDKAPPLR